MIIMIISLSLILSLIVAGCSYSLGRKHSMDIVCKHRTANHGAMSIVGRCKDCHYPLRKKEIHYGEYGVYYCSVCNNGRLGRFD